jgi:hypothetical protein
MTDLTGLSRPADWLMFLFVHGSFYPASHSSRCSVVKGSWGDGRRETEPSREKLSGVLGGSIANNGLIMQTEDNIELSCLECLATEQMDELFRGPKK